MDSEKDGGYRRLLPMEVVMVMDCIRTETTLGDVYNTVPVEMIGRRSGDAKVGIFRPRQAAQKKVASCGCIEKIRNEIPDIDPSGGYDEVDEVLGLLRVARMREKDAENQVREQRAEILRLQRLFTDPLPAGIEPCRRCGRPGATLHFPGGLLCPDGCASYDP